MDGKDKDKKRIRFRQLLIAVSIFVFCLSFGMLIYRNIHANASRMASDEAARIAGAENLFETEIENVEEKEPLPSLEGDPVAASLAELDLQALTDINEDVCGWIFIPGTLVNYPLLCSEDSLYYLNHTWKKEYNVAGSIFLESQCSSDFSDFNTIIYGHRMENTNMFGALNNYKEQEFLDEHSGVYIRLPDSIRRYDIYAALEAEVTDGIYWVNYSEEAYKQHVIDFGLEQSVVKGEKNPTADDDIITLSTCTGRGHDKRWVVQAVLAAETKMAETPKTSGL